MKNADMIASLAVKVTTLVTMTASYEPKDEGAAAPLG